MNLSIGLPRQRPGIKGEQVNCLFTHSPVVLLTKTGACVTQATELGVYPMLLILGFRDFSIPQLLGIIRPDFIETPSTFFKPDRGRLAQRIERWSPEPKVAGSIPALPSNNFNRLLIDSSDITG